MAGHGCIMFWLNAQRRLPEQTAENEYTPALNLRTEQASKHRVDDGANVEEVQLVPSQTIKAESRNIDRRKECNISQRAAKSSDSLEIFISVPRNFSTKLTEAQTNMGEVISVALVDMRS